MSAYDELAARWQQVMMPNYGTPPVALVQGKGCRVWDADGKDYLDLLAGIAVSSLGHAHPAIVDAVSRQVATLAHTSNLYLHEPGVRLAERLTGLLDDRRRGPGLLLQHRHRGQRGGPQAGPAPRRGRSAAGASSRPTTASTAAPSARSP